ncbi:MAG: cysteine desulfurase family protein [Balneolaceae bacterium]|nr:cysteine desulfurase family protein [Balneolaceae bacterium]MDR9446310.1 cysteine desulfurase family protein [Balneolaceae bacterium]
MEPIYLDHAATTPLDPEVLDAMIPYFSDASANANSAHQLGRRAKVAVEDARESIASLLGAEPAEIIFTSGGTESDNAAIRGVFEAAHRKGRSQIVTSAIEHHAVIHPAECLKLAGASPVYVDVSQTGRVDPEALTQVCGDQTAIVSLMHVNNEVGTLNPLAELAEVAHHHGAYFHTDAVQSVGKLPVDVKDLKVDFLSLSAHKLNGPKGIGVLYAKNGSPWIPLIQGGSQEKRRRGGTLNVPAIVGLAAAMTKAEHQRVSRMAHYEACRTQLLQTLEEHLAGYYEINGVGKTHGDADSNDMRVPQILNLCFQSPEGQTLDGEMLLLNLDIEDVCVSNGSACTSGALEPSHVLLGMGLPTEKAMSSIRISIGHSNTLEEMTHAAKTISKVVKRMYSL